MASWGYYSCINQCNYIPYLCICVCTHAHVCTWSPENITHLGIWERSSQFHMELADSDRVVLECVWAAWPGILCGCRGILTQVLRLEQQVLYGWTFCLAYHDILFRVSIAVGTPLLKTLGKDFHITVKEVWVGTQMGHQCGGRIRCSELAPCDCPDSRNNHTETVSIKPLLGLLAPVSYWLALTF